MTLRSFAGRLPRSRTRSECRPRPTAHPRHDTSASGRAPQDRPGAPRARQRRQHPRHLLARLAAHAVGRGREDRRGNVEGNGGLVNDGIDKTSCLAFETLTIAYHEAGHAVAQLLVRPARPLTGATILPEGDDLGMASFEDYADLIVSDTDGEDAEVRMVPLTRPRWLFAQWPSMSLRNAPCSAARGSRGPARQPASGPRGRRRRRSRRQPGREPRASAGTRTRMELATREGTGRP